MITAVARAITRGSSLVKSLTFGGDARARSPSDGSGLALPCASLHIGPRAQKPAPPGLQGGADGALGPPRPVTEIPEHLLKRSKERRAAIGGEEAPASDAPPAGEAVEAAPAAPAPVAAAVAATPEPVPVPEPVRPEVAAAMGRKKIPFWAMPVLAALPLWAYVYQATLEPAPTGELTPVEEGGEIYKSAACSGCHGAGGAGQRQRPRPHRGARDLARLPRPDDVGAPRVDRAGRSSPTPTAPPTSPWPAACPPTPRSTTRSWRSSCSTSGCEFGGLEEDSRGVPELLLEIAEGETTFAEAGLGELSAEAGIPEEDLAAGLSPIAGRLGRTGRLTP